MSVMTDVIMIMQYEGGKGKTQRLKEINDYLRRDADSYYNQPGAIPGFQLLEEDCHNGKFDTGIVHGDINYLGLEEFMDHLKKLPWNRLDLLQLLVKEEDDVTHSLYVFEDGEFVKKFIGVKR